jgi:hypothetical protein
VTEPEDFSTWDCWWPGRIVEHLKKGLIVPDDWRERLTRAGYTLPPEPEPSLFDELEGE